MIKLLLRLFAALSLVVVPTAALAQTSGGFSGGAVLTAAGLNAAFSAKQDYPLGAFTGTSSSSNCLAVGRAGTTNPALQVDCSTASSATGVKIKAAAAAGGVAISVNSSGSNEPLTIDAKGTGTITLGGTSSGAVSIPRPTTLTGATSTAALTANGANNSAGYAALFAGQYTGAGGANTIIVADANNTTGASIALYGDGVTTPNKFIKANGGHLKVVNSGYSVNIVDLTDGGVLTASGGLLAIGQSGVGYSTGAGGTVTQGTSRTTGVTLNKVSGQITLFSAAGSATPFTFVVTNSSVAATDTVSIGVNKAATDHYRCFAEPGAGSFDVTCTDETGTTTETPTINYNVVKGSSS